MRLRRQPNQRPRPRIVIACEGSETEPAYFNSMRRNLGLTPQTINVIKCPNTDPEGIVRQVIGYRNDERDWGREDQAWAVFDGDEHQHDTRSRENWNTAFQLARSNKIGLAISNPSFEFWYLLHFREHWAHLDKHIALRLLREHILGYQKGQCPYPDPLAALTVDATRRAQELSRRAEYNGLGEFDNPCTHAWKLVHEIFMLRPAG